MVAEMQFTCATVLFCFVLFCFVLFCFVFVFVFVFLFFEILPVQPQGLILHMFVCLYQIRSSTNLEQIYRVYQRAVNSSKKDSDLKCVRYLVNYRV